MKARAIPKTMILAVVGLATPTVAYYEGLVPRTYVDVVGVPTQCYGHTGPDVVIGQVFTEAECRAQLSADIQKDVDDVNACINVPLTVGQGAALVDFAHNFGRQNLCTSTLAAMANAGAPPERWCYQLTRWVKARVLGQLIVLPGLVKRRETALRMCLGDLSAVPT